MWVCVLAFLPAVAPADQEASVGRSAPRWTVMIYGGVNSSAEDHIMPHLRSLTYLSRAGQASEVVLLIDRAAGFSEDADVLGANFEDTRLFRLTSGAWERVSGGEHFPEITTESSFEANTGDARTLRKFIQFGKATAPADRYALIVFGHGQCQSVCPDMDSVNADNGDAADELYSAEITEVLSQAESVDLAWFDVCSFGGVENAYEFRPGTGRFSAAAMIATPPSSVPAPMRDIFKNAGLLGAQDGAAVPADGVAFGRLALKITEDRLRRAAGMDPAIKHQCWACYDLSAAGDVKAAVDVLARRLAVESSKDAIEAIRGANSSDATMHYFPNDEPRAWKREPHFDLYDLARRMADRSDFSTTVRDAARGVMAATDRLVADSFGMEAYDGFAPGRNGVFIVFPDGDALDGSTKRWGSFQWYHPLDQRRTKAAFGNYAWCRDGATPDNKVVENWFELLDAWYDEPDARGGLNGYGW